MTLFVFLCMIVGMLAAVGVATYIGFHIRKATKPVSQAEPSSFRQAAKEQALGDSEWDLFEASDTHSQDDWDRKYAELRNKYPLWRLWR